MTVKDQSRGQPAPPPRPTWSLRYTPRKAAGGGGGVERRPGRLVRSNDEAAEASL